MMKTLAFCLALSLAGVAFCKDQPTLAERNNAFACDLYGQLKTAPGNIFFSPFSVSSALAMVYGGARGETEMQMQKTLRFPPMQSETHAAFAEIFEQLAAVQKEGKTELALAHSLWPHKGYPFLPDYLALMKKYYGAEITPVDFANQEPAARAAINKWAEEKTRGKIKNLLAEPLDPLTRMVLVNAIYFKGFWETPFKREQTKEEKFFISGAEPVQVPLMTQTAYFKLGAFPEAQILELPYKDNALSMFVILPVQPGPEALQAVEKLLESARLAQCREAMSQTEVVVSLPKFKITWGAESLKKPLIVLGMNAPFSDQSDFSGMDGTRDLFLADVLQKAFVEVNEEGTEAAAATAGIMALRSVPMPPKVFRADRSFLFLIVENKTGSILFIGRVIDPR